ncbi:MAG: sodium:proton antiporter [Planctomycetaceae bacterium]|jgi:Na+/H+ antiporter NhaD/arsenite permease-like protein|nr:sodium:proton antiporter [Planctomycetaceae bacterium]
MNNSENNNAPTETNSPETNSPNNHTKNESDPHAPQPSKLLLPVAVALIFILLFYAYLVANGLPQKWTEQAISAHHAEKISDNTEPSALNSTHENSTPTEPAHASGQPQEVPLQSPADSTATEPTTAESTAAESTATSKHQRPPLVMVLPFVLLLFCIAFLPLIPAAERFWESNLNKFLVAFSLGVVTLLYYFFGCNFPVELHWPTHQSIDPSRGGFAIASAVFTNAILDEFIPFIVLLFSLFTITGGIRINGNLIASPLTNSIIILIGALLASFIGTTGAAMILIRLLIETNKERKYKVHTIIFFIFCVCNCGGCLTPLGDPPLFLGYLKGIEFTWTLHLWREWLFVNLLLIGLFFVWDTFWYYPLESAESKLEDIENFSGISFSGLKLNLPLLIGVVVAVACLAPSKPFPFTNWHPWFFLREAVQLGLCAVSLFFGGRIIRRENGFNFLAIGEVAALFFGIFICMQAPLQILNVESQAIVSSAEKNLGLEKSKLFFWSTGSLSSVLDNAPTYVVFFEIAKALSPDNKNDFKKDEWKNTDWQKKLDNGELVPIGNNGYIDFRLLVAVSIGAVFMGAMTYIGNGPNFMVKAIAEQSGIKMPGFMGYMLYSCVILLPVLILMTFIFL